MLKNFIITNHLGKNHKISDLFRHLKVGQIECRKRLIFGWSGETIYKCTTVRKWRAFTRRFSSFNANAIGIMHYAGKLKPYSVVSKDAGLILKIRA